VKSPGACNRGRVRSDRPSSQRPRLDALVRFIVLQCGQDTPPSNRGIEIYIQIILVPKKVQALIDMFRWRKRIGLAQRAYEFPTVRRHENQMPR